MNPHTHENTSAQPDPKEESLGRLGALVRQATAPTRSVDLKDRVLAACRASGTAPMSDPDATEIEAFFQDPDEDLANPGLKHLRLLVREASTLPRQPNLVPAVTQAVEAAAAARRSRKNHGASWYVWTSVIGGHLAALVVLGIIRLQTATPPPSSDAEVSAALSQYRVDLELMRKLAEKTTQERKEREGITSSWSAVPVEKLLSLRQDASLREQSLFLHSAFEDLPLIDGGLSWLSKHDLAKESVETQAVVLLALLGQGTDDPVRKDRALEIARRLPGLMPDKGPISGLILLSMTEAAMQLPETDVKQVFTLLKERAVEEPSVTGAIARELSGGKKTEPSSAVLQMFLTRVRGGSPKPEDRQALEGLIAKGFTGLDSENLFLVALTAREEGGKTWAKTHEILRESWIAQGTRSEGMFSIGQDPLSTAWAVVTMQVPYRYLRCVGNKM